MATACNEAKLSIGCKNRRLACLAFAALLLMAVSTARNSRRLMCSLSSNWNRLQLQPHAMFHLQSLAGTEVRSWSLDCGIEAEKSFPRVLKRELSFRIRVALFSPASACRAPSQGGLSRKALRNGQDSGSHLSRISLEARTSQRPRGCSA